MKEKLKLNELKIKSFITIQSNDSSKTIKAGNFGSDGPPLTTTAGSGHIPCSEQCESNNCGESYNCNNPNTGNNPQNTQYCGGGGGVFITQ